jgi:hypothetical protein
MIDFDVSSISNLVGAIPSEIGLLNLMEYFDVQNADISGPTPTEFYKMKNLQSVATDNSFIDGTISSLVGQLTNLSK